MIIEWSEWDPCDLFLRYICSLVIAVVEFYQTDYFFSEKMQKAIHPT